ncbi:hypothetical protein NECID01_0003 [Nematocida sp. AWRm77]|nr:hypothetical protein NECID01_0003 [Nematocida sp. AWRm77]
MEEKKKEECLHPFEESPLPAPEKRTRVSELAAKLEKSLDINHFLNIRFHRQNHGLYEKLCRERDMKEKHPNNRES